MKTSKSIRVIETPTGLYIGTEQKKILSGFSKYLVLENPFKINKQELQELGQGFANVPRLALKKEDILFNEEAGDFITTEYQRILEEIKHQ